MTLKVHAFVTIILFFSVLHAFPQNQKQLIKSDPFLTLFERTNYQETDNYENTIAYCKLLDKNSAAIRYTTFGKSAQGRDLPLLIIDDDSCFTPSEIRSKNKLIVLIQAGIHAGEIDGKDAFLMLARDILLNRKHSGMFDNISVLFIPVFNVDGFIRFGEYNRINQNGPKETGWRTNAQNLNLNRDFVKADAPEMQAWLNLFNEWSPDFFIDIHVTDGADYQYPLTYSMEIFGNMDVQLTKWQKDVFLNKITKKMNDDGNPVFPYVAFRNWHDPRSGLRSWVSNPMLSTGYTAVRNRPGLLVENHMLKSYKTRVYVTYDFILHCFEILNTEASTLRLLIREADKITSTPDFRILPFPLSFKSTNDSVIVDFLGYEYTVEKSDLTGGEWFKYSSVPKTFKIPYFNTLIPDTKVILPDAYIIPPEYKELVARIINHGIEVKEMHDSATIKVKSYRFKDVKWRPNPYEGHQICTFVSEEIEEYRYYPPGSFIISMNQPLARLIAHILEPSGPDSYIYWGFFNSIFEQKEYGESYVLEKLAREMIMNNPVLKSEFELMKKNDKSFASNSWEQLNWFYNQSVYADAKMAVYPVGRIFNQSR